MSRGGGKFDVTHPVASHRRLGDLDAATLTSLALVALALVLTAGAFEVLFGSKDALVEQAVALGA